MNFNWRQFVPAAILLGSGVLVAGLVGFVWTSGLPQEVIWATLGVLTVSFWLMHHAVRLFSFRTMSIPGFSYLVYLITILLPALSVYQAHPGPARNAFLFAVESASITIPLGSFFVNFVTSYNPRETRLYFEKPMASLESGSDSILCPAFLLALALGLAAKHMAEMPTVPLFYMILHPGAPILLAMLREEAFKLLASNLSYGYALNLRVLYPYVVLLSFGGWLITRSTKWITLFAVSLITAVIYSAATIEKSYVAFLAADLFMYFYLYRHGRVRTRTILASFTAFIAFPMLVVLLQYSRNYHGILAGFGYSFGAVAERLFNGPAETMYYYFTVFPRFQPFQHGASIELLCKVMGWRRLNVPNFVGIYAEIVEFGTAPFLTISANAGMVGSFYVDFGLYSVLIGCFLAGAIMQAAQVYLTRAPKSASNVAIYAFLFPTFGFLNSAALPTTLLSGGVIPVFVLAWLVTRLDNMFVPASEPRPDWVTQPSVIHSIHT